MSKIYETGLSCFVPRQSGIKKGDRRMLLWSKVDGDMQLVSVMAASDPYRKGKASFYIEVFGAGVRCRGVNIKKLLKVGD